MKQIKNKLTIKLRIMFTSHIQNWWKYNTSSFNIYSTQSSQSLKASIFGRIFFILG